MHLFCALICGAMSRICDVCQKSYVKGNLVPRGIGRRVTSRTIRTQKPNLRIKHLTLGQTRIRVKLCASCLKRIKKDQKAFDQATAELAVQAKKPVSQ